MRALERYLLLQIIDERWREHLYDMDYLREGIHLRGFAQIEPLVAYKNEAFDAVHRPDELDLVGLHPDDLQRPGRGAGRERPSRRRAQTYRAGGHVDRRRAARLLLLGGGPVGASAISAAAAEAAASGEPIEAPTRRSRQLLPEPVEQRRVDESEQIGRNDPCWCGSGKKFKKCHGA